MLDLARKTATLGIFIRLRSEISSKWSLMPSTAYTCTEAELWVVHPTSYLLLNFNAFILLKFAFYLHLFFVSQSWLQKHAQNRNIGKNNGIKRNERSILSWRKTIWNECCGWIWKKITVISKIVLTCCVLHNGSTAITALFRSSFSFLSMLLIICALTQPIMSATLIQINILTNKMWKKGRGT